MPEQLPWNTKAMESARAAVGEHDLQLTEDQIPILVSGMPVLHDALRRQIKHLVLCDLPELAVQPFDDIRRIYDFPNLRRVFEKGV